MVLINMKYAINNRKKIKNMYLYNLNRRICKFMENKKIFEYIYQK